VVSTSSAGTEQRLLDYSNSGEVMMQAQNPYDGSGTSFAAPHLSAIEALYLLHGGPVQCDGHLPPLGYADSDSGVDTWDNLYLGFGSAIGATVPATGAALTKCTTFQSLAQ
jgi:hypothetical protein